MSEWLVALVSSRARYGKWPQRRLRGGGELIVERVVARVATAGPANYPILSKTNYHQWALLMRIKLKALWVVGGG
jgi:hypothetical protein